MLKNCLYGEVDCLTKRDISKANLRELFTFATSQTHFLFNGLFYDQCDGVTMGSPLAPILANLFMGYHEEQWMKLFGSICPAAWPDCSKPFKISGNTFMFAISFQSNFQIGYS